jgi:uncharacterized protein YcbX
MAAVGVISELWRYPVKSMGGESLDSLELDARGPVGDRLWALHDTDGKLGSGKNSKRFRRMDGLLDMSARLVNGEPLVTLADGTQLRGLGAATDAALATALQHPGVRLMREAELSHFDDASIHLVTTSALRWFSQALPDAQITARRFRPNIVIETEGVGRPEEEWVGQELSIGPVLLRVSHPTERCAMVSASQPGIEADSRILKTLGERTDLIFGVYAEILRHGQLRVGDTVALGAASA